jgi:cell fate (sporulation/competence/biofilm development) regulator YlbF (YheA/YmcA/DUF963 family)
MLELISEKARELGRHLSQTEEYRAITSAREAMDADREMVTRLNRLLEVESSVTAAMQAGEAPEESVREEYEALFAEVQASPIYQRLVAAQSNFDKILMRVNEEISKGMEEGAKSRIILPS